MSHVLRSQRIVSLAMTLLLGSYPVFAGAQTADTATKDDTHVATTTAESQEDPEVVPPPPLAEEMTVTATRFERPIDLTPQSVTVFGAQEIHERPLWSMQSILEDVPGISYQRSGAQDGQLVVRGLSSNDSRTVLFIDGDRFRGRPSLEHSFIDPNEIERIEIIRGPASALYGADAMNGVVNVITRRAEGDPRQSFSLKPRLYSFGYSSANELAATRLELQGLGNGFDMLIGANYRTAGNYDSPLGEVPNSDFTTRSLNVRLGYSPTTTRRFEIIAKAADVETGTAGRPGAPLVVTRQVPLQERSVRLGFTQSQVASWLQDVEASFYARDENTIIRSETRTATNGNAEFRDTWVIGPVVTGGKLLARSVVGKNILTYGVDVYREDVPPFEDEVRVINRAGAQVSFSPRAKRIRAAVQTDIGALAHYDWDPSSRWTVSLGGRYDLVRTDIDAKPALNEDPALSAAFARNLSARDNALTGSAGVIFRPLSTVHLVGNISTAFRTPTTFDKSGSGVVGALTTLPNAELSPESSVNYEAGVRLRLHTVDANLTAFRSDYEDLLQFVFLNPNTRQRMNVGRATIEGFELDGSYAMTGNLAWRFNASNVRATNTVTNNPLPNVPPLNGAIALRHTWPGSAYWLEVADRWSRDKTRIDRTQERPTDSYQVLSLYGGADLGRFSSALHSYRITVGIDNLTDEEYVLPGTRELVGFPVSSTNPLMEPGRSLTINITAGF
jgi:hemoglobin/transferrin/lactoferrin receptor protein